MSYFLVSVRYDNYLQLKETDFKLIGFPAYSKRIESIEPGDKFILYIGSGKSLIPGIIESTSQMFWSTEFLWDDIFPKRIKTKKYIMLNQNNYVSMREIKNGLSFINPDVKKFGVYFMQGLRELSEEDYSYIYKKVAEKANETG